MSTSAERAARLKAKGTGDGELGDSSGRAARLKAAEEAAALAVQAAKQAAAAAEAAARTAQELRAEIAAEKGEEEDAEEEEEEAESRNWEQRTPSLDRRRSQSPLRDRRRGRGGVATNHRAAEWCTATLVAAHRGRCWTSRTTTSGVRP